ncbi:MAG: TlpA family protein disulfide reductase [Acidobacteriota bacterium]|nr:TlpA family protein disulfide reductase [Acidobacteriota bacterium]
MTKSLLALILLAGSAAGATIPRPAPELAIHMTDGNQTLLSSYRGKVVLLAFVFTTCSHCQNVTGILNNLQAEYAPKGVQVLESCFNDGAANLTAAFKDQYVRGFPVGYDDKLTVLEFLQHSAIEPYFVPIIVYVDRKGIIRSQYIGDEQYLKNPEASIRASLDALLKEPASGIKNMTRRKAGASTTSSLHR